MPAGLCSAGSQAQLPVFQLAFGVEQLFGQKSGSGGRKGSQTPQRLGAQLGHVNEGGAHRIPHERPARKNDRRGEDANRLP
ncbi:hypothetical protein RA307_11325 [Xanthobacteraceae bacterium Astr-EGSB]|uniref:hypothetical protein n=1 Tax=Astrobacterium formosum TaxID=3069710 RepID=UPI0027AFF175|nr:hypothetical protein [Xanthobacteraceae bacterium Astr-EGSB]